MKENIIELMKSGFKTTEIATMLDISIPTINSYFDFDKPDFSEIKQTSVSNFVLITKDLSVLEAYNTMINGRNSGNILNSYL